MQYRAVQNQVEETLKDVDGNFGPHYREMNTRLASFKNDPPAYENDLVQFKQEKQKLEDQITEQLMAISFAPGVKQISQEMQELQNKYGKSNKDWSKKDIANFVRDYTKMRVNKAPVKAEDKIGAPDDLLRMMHSLT